MTDLERKIWCAIHDADAGFQKRGDAGTKTWMRDYFLPALTAHGLQIVEIEKAKKEGET